MFSFKVLKYFLTEKYLKPTKFISLEKTLEFNPT